MSTGALARVVRRNGSRHASGRDRCELCAEEVPDGHRHLYDEGDDALRCVCRACGLLFERDAAARGQYRLVPDRRIRVPEVSAAELGAPVNLAFFVRQAGGGVRAHYPSPAGATRWDVEPAAWEHATARCEPLRSMRPEVEALLLNTVRGADERWLVPIDDCYRLVAVVRRHWTGLSGGDRVWPEVERFFADLRGERRKKR